MIHVFGELALHVFTPVKMAGSLAYRPTSESPIQLGGGAAIVAQSILARGERVKLHGICGNDVTGTILSDLARWKGLDSPVNEQGAQSSCVYIHHDWGIAIGLTIEPGTVSVASLEARAVGVEPNDIVVCPYFPGYEQLARRLCESGGKVILDAGFIPWLNDCKELAQRLRKMPKAAVVQLNAEGIAFDELEMLMAATFESGAEVVIATAGAGPIRFAEISGEVHTISVPGPATMVKCAVGAGDVFAGIVACGIQADRPLAEVVAKAISVATEKTTRWGI